MAMGDKMYKIIATALEELGSHGNHITVCRWRELETPQYVHAVNALSSAYTTEPELQRRIDDAAGAFLASCPGFKKGLKPKKRESHMKHVVQYFLAELPLVVAGAHVGGVRYRFFLYPSTADKVATLNEESMVTAVALWIRTQPRFAALCAEISGHDTLVDGIGGIELAETSA